MPDSRGSDSSVRYLILLRYSYYYPIRQATQHRRIDNNREGGSPGKIEHGKRGGKTDVGQGPTSIRLTDVTSFLWKVVCDVNRVGVQCRDGWSWRDTIPGCYKGKDKYFSEPLLTLDTRNIVVY